MNCRNARLARGAASLGTPLVTVVVLNYNGQFIIDKCLESVLFQDYPSLEVVVVDNASNDRSISIIANVAERHRNVRLVTNDKNLGYVGGMNSGATRSSVTSEFLAFVTNDVILSPTWVREAVTTAMSDHRIGAVSSRIYDRKSRVWISTLLITFPSAAYYIPLNEDRASSDIHFPSGEAFLIRKWLFNRLGGFDESYFIYYDDGDLGWRIRLAGLRVISSQAAVEHEREYTLSRSSEVFRRYLFDRNRINSCLKNMSFPFLLAFLLHEAVRPVGYIARDVARRSSTPATKAYAFALAHVVLNLPKTLRKRAMVQRTRAVADDLLFRPRIIYLNSFLFRSISNIPSKNLARSTIVS